MNKFQLTAEELLFVYLIFISQSENGNPEEHRYLFKKWYVSGGNKRLKSLFESLQEKGVILKSYKPIDEFDPDEVELNSSFVKQYFKLTGELGLQLYNAYPISTWINGRNVSLRNVTKKFLDLNQFAFWYATTIGHNLQKHKEIMEILD
ncbi:MAG: hypothetical protein KBT03_10275 [Bacteroidales bacterium]|nr:hypothetical protein [Candidatus Scybalousia scybalohippi]